MRTPQAASPSSREKILEVAEAHFARRGFSGVGLREVAVAAGLGKSSLFHHFESKAQLYFEVLERVLGRIQVRLEPALAKPAGALERLDAWVDALVGALAEHPATARLLLRGLVEEEDFPVEPLPEAQRAEALLAEILQGIHALLREGIEQGAFRNVSVPHTVQTLIGATVYHFASGEVGESIMGRPLLSAEAVRRRKQELRNLLHQGLAAPGAD
ncbi:MAG TPA: TetR/AcrR family transcriptional regulator [Myxococcota bacterium]|jgi:AcrR family transcriptional regulator